MKKLSILAINSICIAAASPVFAATGDAASGSGITLGNILLIIFVGLLVSFVVTAVMKSKLKSVRTKREACDYVKEGSFVLTSSYERFLYREVERIPKPKNNPQGGQGGSRI